MGTATKITLMILFYLAPVIRAGDVLDALQGSWEFDKKGTVAELKKYKWWTEKRLAVVKGVSGKQTIRYEGKKYFVQTGDLKLVYEITVLREDGRIIEVEWEDTEFGRQTRKIEVFEDHLWITSGQTEHLRERFTRIKAKAEQSASTPESKPEGKKKPQPESEARAQ